MSVAINRGTTLLAGAALCAAALSCDKDPADLTGPVLALAQCPVGLQSVNSPILLSFNQAVVPSTVTGANVVVTDATTGFEIPGSVAVAVNNAQQVVFTPSQTLPFDKVVRVRIQNLQAASGRGALTVTVCDVRTELPPIRELYWGALPNAGGNVIVGVSLVEPGYGYVVARSNRLFRYVDSSITALPLPSYYTTANDASFVTRDHGFASVTESRQRRSVVLETFDGGVTYDTIGFATAQVLNRTYFRPIPSEAQPFGVVAGGQTFSPAYFMKYHPSTKTFAVSSFSGTGGVSDLDFTSDTISGAASTLGIVLGTRTILGTVFATTNGGSTWQEIAGATAPDSVVTYQGIAIRSNGEIYVTGGSGYVARLTPSGTGTYTVQRVILAGVSNPQPDNPYALIYNDVQFAPGNDQVGWIIGALQIGSIGGTPRYEGLIFMTRDGGQTWTRQGVSGAPNYGAEFPSLNRIDALSATTAWIVGDGGTVLRYVGAPTP
jgi:hypothetical protein